MKSISFFPLFLLILGTLAYWTVEGAGHSWKAGACPPRRLGKCIRNEKPRCNSDWQCPGNQKCCQDTCVVRCMDSTELPRQAREKPGKCPQVFGECMMLNPPNHCETDGECDNNYKCCKGMCGKACVKPLRDIVACNQNWLFERAPAQKLFLAHVSTQQLQDTSNTSLTGLNGQITLLAEAVIQIIPTLDLITAE
ncbi:antileukoproteinase [Suncus etruscus]|uniref:antileukoproteinase n=1 Tax=Suncus etruscus TaxID=109475 RepID=UPI00210FE81D|nr:antileukoproteinase [Suncus etruscus]